MGSSAPRVLLALLLALAAACARERALPPSAPLVYDGATSISRRILADAVPQFQGRTGIAVKVRHSGTGRGLQAVFAGEVSVAGVARALTAAELSRRPYFQIFGYDALGVFVNGSNPVRNLTREQLKDIFTGRVTNWREVGGPNEPIVPCAEHVDSGRATVEAFQALVMEGAPYGASLRQADDPADCVHAVAAVAGGITPATMTYSIEGVHAVAVSGIEPVPQNVRSSAYLLTRPLLLVAREPPQGDLKLFFDFMLSPDAQAIVARNGFVPAR
ncbi:MAG TPA: phosphate ABC transporter substrate-binding protein [Anaeromyxobacteraceae bacterium]|nr:phosphate ABC transporter substrate-binding protein [Anaeromyxobacteraceae bacterium]